MPKGKRMFECSFLQSYIITMFARAHSLLNSRITKAKQNIRQQQFMSYDGTFVYFINLQYK